jgi:hypothetical protein
MLAGQLTRFSIESVNQALAALSSWHTGRRS